MHPQKSADDDATIKVLPGGPPPGTQAPEETKWSSKADDDATVKISPGGPPPIGSKRLREAVWSLTPGESLNISVGNGLRLVKNSKGCVIKTKKQK